MRGALPTTLLLDTDVCIDVMRRRDGGVADDLLRSAETKLVLSRIVLAELDYGVALSQRPGKSRIELNEFACRCTVVDFDENAARFYGTLRAQLRASGQEIGPMDLLIAAHALALELPLMTGNVREFKRVPGLGVIALPKS